MNKVPVDLTRELQFRTARSSGKGGQNVNKVETKVEALFNIAQSEILTAEQKKLLFQKLSNRINNSGLLAVSSQATRSQLENKEKVISKINELVREALKPSKKRKPTRPSAAAKEERLKKKKKTGEKKKERQNNPLREL